MRVRASRVLERSSKVYRWKVIDYLDRGHLNRINRLAAIEQAAADFAGDVLVDFDLPGIPDLSVGNIRGFEDDRPIQEVTGYIVINASFTAWSGYIVRMAMPIPVYKGEFLRPSIIIVNNRRIPFSQSALDRLASSADFVMPKIDNYYLPDPSYQHIEELKRGMFAPPDPPPGTELEQMLDVGFRS